MENGKLFYDEWGKNVLLLCSYELFIYWIKKLFESLERFFEEKVEECKVM